MSKVLRRQLLQLPNRLEHLAACHLIPRLALDRWRTVPLDVLFYPDKFEEYHESLPTNDDVNHPSHYTSHPSGVECITITEHHNFNVGNAIKYLWRAGLKDDVPVKDLQKAVWYIQREIERLSKKG